MKYEDIKWEDLNIHQEMGLLPNEEWKVMTHLFDGVYAISNYGRCKRWVSYGADGRSLPKKVIKITDNGNGYKKFALSFNGKTKNVYIHRMVATYFLENPNNLPQVNHKPSGLGKFDNRVEHLEWCTEKNNIKDAHKNGQMVNRTLHNTKVDRKSDEFVEVMYRHYKETGMVGETAKKFGVSRTTLSSIVNKRSRTKITDLIDKEYEDNL